jgi:hypothetical protein
MRRALLGLSLAAVLSFALSSAQAASVQVLNTTNPWTQVDLGNTTNTFGGTWDVPANIRTGSIGDVTRSPFDGSGGDNSSPANWEDLAYFAVGPSNAPSPALLEFATGQTSLTFLWGSVDDYNTVTFLDAASTVLFSINSDDLLAAAPPVVQFGIGAALVRIFGFDTPFFGIQFSSSKNAFEFSNIVTTTAVPIPPALLLFGSALAGLGYLMRRRRDTGPQPA